MFPAYGVGTDGVAVSANPAYGLATDGVSNVNMAEEKQDNELI